MIDVFYFLFWYISKILNEHIHGLSGKSPAIVNIMRMVCTTSMWPGSQGEWTGLCVNNDNFTVLVSLFTTVEWACVLCGYCIQNDWEQSNESASKFVLSVNIPPRKLFGWFRRPQLRATGDWQLHHDSTPAGASRLMQFWQNIKSPRWLSPPTAQIWCSETSGFSQN